MLRTDPESTVVGKKVKERFNYDSALHYAVNKCKTLSFVYNLMQILQQILAENPHKKCSFFQVKENYNKTIL